MEFAAGHKTVIHKVTLTISEKELELLKALVQNPQCSPEDEPEELRNLRKNLWDIAEGLLNKNW